jgi:hypothetical protein
MSWDNWLDFIDDAGMCHFVGDAPVQRQILAQIGSLCRDRGQRFKSRETIISYLRRTSRQLLTQSYVLQRDAEYIIELHLKGHRLQPGSTLLDVAAGHSEAEDAYLAHRTESQRRYRYFWPSDLAEAARLWCDEATDDFPPDLSDYVEQRIAEMSAAELFKAIGAERTALAPRRKRL